MATKTQNPFAADQFMATAFDTAQQKAKFANQFVRFVLSGFRPTLFPKWFYQRLSNTFGHIAHYNQSGFWSQWFATPEQQRRFLQRVHEHVPCGHAEHTYCDVERALKSWVATQSEAIAAVLEEKERKHSAAVVSESQRRRALREETHQRFKVLAKSSNTGAFGHRQYVLGADDGSAYTVERTYLYSWDVGQIIHVPLDRGVPTWSAVQCENPQRRSCRAEALRRPA